MIEIVTERIIFSITSDFVWTVERREDTEAGGEVSGALLREWRKYLKNFYGQDTYEAPWDEYVPLMWARAGQAFADDIGIQPSIQLVEPEELPVGAIP